MTFMNGVASKNVLIVHGWMHSADRYKKFAKKLLNCKVNIVDLPGFGNCGYVGAIEKVEDYHIEYLRTLLTDEKYDFVIAHSWGGIVLLKTIPLLDVNQKPDIILLNPAYGENKRLKILLPIKKITGWLLATQKNLPFWIVKIPIKISALLTINRWSLIDDNIIYDAKRSDPRVASYLLYVMACDKWVIKEKKDYGKSYLIFSDKDRIIGKHNIENLKMDLQPTMFKVFYGVGHTLVVENFEELVILIEKIIWGNLKDEEIFNEFY